MPNSETNYSSIRFFLSNAELDYWKTHCKAYKPTQLIFKLISLYVPSANSKSRPYSLKLATEGMVQITLCFKKPDAVIIRAFRAKIMQHNLVSLFLSELIKQHLIAVK